MKLMPKMERFLKSMLCLEIFRYSDGEIHFNLMAIVSDRKMIYQRRIEEILKKTQVNSYVYIKKTVFLKIFQTL